MEKKNIQEKVADTILERPFKVKVGGKEYEVSPPTIGTLIEVSEKIGQLPQMDLSSDDVIGSVVRNARKSRYLPDICALLILGAKKASQRPFRIIGPTRAEMLAKRLFYGSTPKELGEAISSILARLGVADFFAISTFLQGLNITKPTKVEKTTSRTASGQ